MTGFPSRSFENNWNIYKLLAHQKVSTEKVRGVSRRALVTVTSGACPWVRPPARRAGVCPGSRKL